MKTRDRSFDIAKGIGILCVVLGHFGNYHINKIVYTFHLPMFFFITGWFLNEKKDPKIYFIDRCRTLLPAYGITSICLCFLNVLTSVFIHHADGQVVISNAVHVLMNALYGSGSNINRMPWGIHQIGAIWFLLAMIWASSFVRLILATIHHGGYRLLTVIAAFVVCWFSAKWIWLPFSVQAGGCAALYVYLGWAIRCYLEKPIIREYYDKYRIIVLPLGIFALIYCYMLGINVNIVSVSFPFFPLSVFMSVLIVAGFLRLSSMIERIESTAKCLSFFGRYSLLILSIHLMELDYFPWWSMINGQMIIHGLNEALRITISFCLKVVLYVVLTFLVSGIYFVQKSYRIPSAKEFIKRQIEY